MLTFLGKHRIAKYALSIMGAIILGALGSGLWNAVLAPLFSIAYNSILTVITFGITSIKNGTYLDIAKGMHEEASVHWLNYFGSFLFSIPISLVIYVYFTRILIQKIIEKADEKESRESRWIFLRRILLFCLIIFLVLTSMLAVPIMLTLYKNKAVTHFAQCFTICRPYMDLTEEKMIQANFAKIRNREDYVRVLSALEQIALRNRDEIPKFDPW